MPRRGFFDQPPVVVFTEELSGVGEFRSAETLLPVARFSLTKATYDIHAQWQFHAFCSEADHLVWDKLLRGKKPPTFLGRDVSRRRIEIDAVYYRRRVGNEIWADAPAVSIGDPALPEDCASQFIEVVLWPTPFAEPEAPFLTRWWDGRLAPFDGDEPEEQRVVTVAVAGHLLRLSGRVEWEEPRVGNQTATLSIPVSGVWGEVTPEKRTREPAELARALETGAEDLCRLLTFLSRRHVRVSRVGVSSQTAGGEPYEYQRVFGSTSSHRDRDSSELLVPGRMPEDALQRLLDAYRRLPKKEAIATAMLYLTVAHDSQFLDSRLAYAYTAFEATLTALGGGDGAEFTIGSASFRRLSDRLKAEIRTFAAAEALAEDVVHLIERKLPELRRRPLLDRALEAIVALGVDVSMVWPESVDLRSGLNAIFNRRNRFIHAGELPPPAQVQVDAVRLMILTELMILGALGADPQWLHPRAHGDWQYLTMLPEPVP